MIFYNSAMKRDHFLLLLVSGIRQQNGARSSSGNIIQRGFEQCNYIVITLKFVPGNLAKYILSDIIFKKLKLNQKSLVNLWVALKIPLCINVISWTTEDHKVHHEGPQMKDSMD